MAKQLEVTAQKLVRLWLAEQFPLHLTEVELRGLRIQPYWDPSDEEEEFEIIVDCVTVAELQDTTLKLLHPDDGVCTAVLLANPESLTLLRECIIQHLYSHLWRNTMENNRASALMIPGARMDIVHRSSLGYKVEWK